MLYLLPRLPRPQNAMSGGICVEVLCGAKGCGSCLLGWGPKSQELQAKEGAGQGETSGGARSQVHRRCPSSPTLPSPAPTCSHLRCGYHCCVHFTKEKSKACRHDITSIKSEGWWKWDRAWKQSTWLHSHRRHPAFCRTTASLHPSLRLTKGIGSAKKSVTFFLGHGSGSA